MNETPVPPWAMLPAAGKLLVECLKHPSGAKVILVDEEAHTVRVVPFGASRHPGDADSDAAGTGSTESLRR